MEVKENFIEPLLEKAEQFSKTSFELLKLKSLDKVADIVSTLTSRLLLVIIISLFVLALNIAAGLWLGDLLGKNYHGFLAVALFYGLLATIYYFIHPFIKERIGNAIVKQMLD